MKQQPGDFTLGELHLLREEHVIVARCFEIHSTQPNPPTSGSFQSELCERRVLHLELISDAFIDFSSRHICLEAPRSLEEETHQSSNSFSEPPVIEVTPHISVCPAPTAGGVLGMLAVYPALDSGSEQPDGRKAVWSPGEDHGGRAQTESFVGIYDILDSGKLRLSAWAAVPTRRSLVAGAGLGNDDVISLSLSQEWIAVMTSSAQLYLFSLLESPPIPSAASLSRIFTTAAVVLGLSSPSPPVVAVPVLAPVMDIPFRSQLSSLRFEAEGHRKRVTHSISKLESLEGHLFSSDSKTGVPTDDQIKYFAERRNMFDERLQLGRMAHPEPAEETISESTTRTTNTAKVGSLDLLRPSKPGEMPLLSFRRTRGDGLCLLVVLRCYTTPDPLDPHSDPQTREFRLTPNVSLDLPPQSAPFLLLRSRKEGLEGWWKSPT